MTKISNKLLSVLIPCVVLIVSCSNNKANEENSKAILDTVSLSNKNFALAYQDGLKIVATSIDTMKQISFGGATNPSISPNGNKLAYTVTDSAGHKSIWVADMENKSQLQIQVNSGNYDKAMWSPSGNLIAFNMLNNKNLWKIGVVKPDNTGFMMLDGALKTNVYAPAWKNENEVIAHDLINLYTFNISGKLINTKPITDLIGRAYTLSSSSRFFYTQNRKKLIFNAGFGKAINNRTEAVFSAAIDTRKVTQISPKGINVPYVFLTADDRIFYSGAEKPYTKNKIYVADLKGNIKTIVEKGTNPTGALK